MRNLYCWFEILGRLYISGGATSNAAGSELATTEYYDPDQDKFVQGPNLPYGLNYQTAVVISETEVILAGGYLQGPRTFHNKFTKFDVVSG